MKLRLLDVYCCAGGAGMGYHQAGFEVVGVDIKSQPHYPFEFHQCDGLEFIRDHWQEFDYIHASPPCQIHSIMTNGLWKDRLDDHPRLIEPTRELLVKSGKPFDIENVPGSPLINPILLCGTMFNLTTKQGAQLRRHRYFETNWQVGLVSPCNHKRVSSQDQQNGRRIPATIGVWGHAGGSSNRDNLIQFGTQDRRDAMGIQWMTGNELSEATPPAYTEFLGRRFLEKVDSRT